MARRSINHLRQSGWIIPALLVTFLVAITTNATADGFDQVEKTLGMQGQVQEGVLIVRFPRTDLTVSIRGEPIPTGLGLISWTAWRTMGDRTLVMGDLVLLENEVAPVMFALVDTNVNITALHNHLMEENPRTMIMHIEGMAKAPDLARALKNALDKTATPQKYEPRSAQGPDSLDTRRIELITGYSGSNVGGTFRITVGRSGVTSRGAELTSSLGLNSWAGFMGTNENAYIAGQIAMTAAEVNRVIRVFRDGGVEVVAVHNNMLNEQPRIFFLHYWGKGPAERLARTARLAFDEVSGPAH